MQGLILTLLKMLLFRPLWTFGRQFLFFNDCTKILFLLVIACLGLSSPRVLALLSRRRNRSRGIRQVPNQAKVYFWVPRLSVVQSLKYTS